VCGEQNCEAPAGARTGGQPSSARMKGDDASEPEHLELVEPLQLEAERRVDATLAKPTTASAAYAARKRRSRTR
jgi:hypothetical protein